MANPDTPPSGPADGPGPAPAAGGSSARPGGGVTEKIRNLTVAIARLIRL
jgi:hypothetical protein